MLGRGRRAPGRSAACGPCSFSRPGSHLPNRPPGAPSCEGGHPGQPLHCSRPIFQEKTGRPGPPFDKKSKRRDGVAEAEAGMLLAEAASAICVQKLDDSRNSAIHTRYRISLRSSSLREPRYPLLRVVFSCGCWGPHGPQLLCFSCMVCGWFEKFGPAGLKSPARKTLERLPFISKRCAATGTSATPSSKRKKEAGCTAGSRCHGFDRCNDPSAGSPTETLLRLLLPLGGRV